MRFKRSYRATMSLVVSLLRLCCRWVIPRKTLQGPHTIRDRLTFFALQTPSSKHHSILHLTLPRGFPKADAWRWGADNQHVLTANTSRSCEMTVRIDTRFTQPHGQHPGTRPLTALIPHALCLSCVHQYQGYPAA